MSFDHDRLYLSGVSELVSRPSSASSTVEEQLAASQSSSSFDYCQNSFKKPKDLTQQAASEEKWIVLKSFANIRPVREGLRLIKSSPQLRLPFCLESFPLKHAFWDNRFLLYVD